MFLRNILMLFVIYLPYFVDFVAERLEKCFFMLCSGTEWTRKM